MATLLISLNLWGLKFFALTDYFRLGGYQNGHRYVKIQDSNETVRSPAYRKLIRTIQLICSEHDAGMHGIHIT